MQYRTRWRSGGGSAASRCTSRVQPAPPLIVWVTWDRVMIELLLSQIMMIFYGGLARFLVARMWDTAVRMLLRARGVQEQPQFSMERYVLAVFPEKDVVPSGGPLDMLIQLGARERERELEREGERVGERERERERELEVHYTLRQLDPVVLRALCKLLEVDQEEVDISTDAGLEHLQGCMEEAWGPVQSIVATVLQIYGEWRGGGREGGCKSCCCFFGVGGGGRVVGFGLISNQGWHMLISVHVCTQSHAAVHPCIIHLVQH